MNWLKSRNLEHALNQNLFNNNNNNNHTSLQRHILSSASRVDDRGPGKKLNNINRAQIKQKWLQSLFKVIYAQKFTAHLWIGHPPNMNREWIPQFRFVTTKSTRGSCVATQCGKINQALCPFLCNFSIFYRMTFLMINRAVSANYNLRTMPKHCYFLKFLSPEQNRYSVSLDVTS